MKKLLLYISLGLLVSFSANASHVKAKFYAGGHKKIKVFINGRKVNKFPIHEVQLDYLSPGKHRARIEVYGRHGKKVIHDQIFLKRGYESSFVINHRYGYGDIVRVGLKPLAYRYPGHYDPYFYYGGNDPYQPRHTPRPVLKQNEYEDLIHRLESARFDGDKISILKNALRHRDIYAEDVLDFMNFFVYESSKLKLAKYAYHKTVDKDKYYLVMDGFRFHSTRRELERYLYQFPM